MQQPAALDATAAPVDSPLNDTTSTNNAATTSSGNGFSATTLLIVNAASASDVEDGVTKQSSADILVEDVSRIESAAAVPTEQEDSKVPPPDGGYGWVIVACSFAVHIFSQGLPASYGVWQQAYKDVPEFSGASSLAIAFIGSLCTAGFPIFSIPAGRMSDKFGPSIVCCVGAGIFILALVLASFSTQLWHLLITQGFLLGLSNSLVYMPAISVLPSWWQKRRGLATGIAISGSGLGGLALGPILRLLISQLGWRWALRVTGIVGGTTCLIAGLLLRIRVPQNISRKLDLSLFKNWTFLRLYIVAIIYSFAYFSPFFFVPTFATQYGMTKEQGALLLGIMSGASGVGRIALGVIADYTGYINMLTGTLGISAAAMLFIWPFAKSFGGLLAFVLTFGFFIGGFISLTPTSIAHIFQSHGNLATVQGMFYNGFVLGNLFGTPIGGAVIDKFTTHDSYGNQTIDFIPAIVFAGCCLTASTVILSTVKYTVGQRRFFVKV